MVSSLIQTNSTPDSEILPESSEPSKSRRALQPTLNFKSAPKSRALSRQPSATLIVAPLSLLAQWKAELDRSSKRGTIKTVIYHGSARADLEALTDDKNDSEHVVVITSYGTLASEHAKTAKGGESSFYEGICMCLTISVVLVLN